MQPQPACPETDHLEALLQGTLAHAEEEAIIAHLDSCPGCRAFVDQRSTGSEIPAGLLPRIGPGEAGQETALRRVLFALKQSEPRSETARPITPTLAGESTFCTFSAGSDFGRPAEGDRAATPDPPIPRDQLTPVELSFLEASDDPQSLGRLGPYEVLGLVGRGGMGTVLKVHDPALKRVVAVKVLAPAAAPPSPRARRASPARVRVRRTAVCHENVVNIHAVDEAGGLPYLVMQLVAGLSLQEKLDRAGPLDPKEILRIGIQVAAGLAAAHEQGLVHRDIKPSNILLENGVERVKITDFGLARVADEASLSEFGTVVGTPGYMSPEQARGEPVDQRTDLYSLGSLLYAMCTGKAPFRAENAVAVLRRVLDEEPRPIRAQNPDIPDGIVAIIATLMAKSPDPRS